MDIFNIAKRVDRALETRLRNVLGNTVFRYLNDDEPVLDFNNFDANKAYACTAAVYECVDLITKKLVASPYIIYEVKDQQGLKAYHNLSKSDNIVDRAKAMKLRASVLEEVKVPDIQRILDQPNHLQDGATFVEVLASTYLLRGNAYAYGVPADKGSKKWHDVFALNADMQIVSGGRFEPVKGYYLNYGAPNQIDFRAEEICHIKTFNPSTDPKKNLYGMSPLIPYLYSIDKLKHSNVQSIKQLKNGGKMGFISPKNKEDELGDDQKNKLKATIQTAHNSSDALARLIPASVPLQWTEIGLSSQDMELLKHSDAAADDIYRGFHVPLYFRTLDSSTYNNVVTAKKAFIYDAVAPIADKIGAALTRFICEPYKAISGKHYIIAFDYMSLPELSDDVKAIMEYLERAHMLTPNEKREMMGFGRSDQNGMDEIFISKNYVRLEDVMAGKILQNTSAGTTDNSAQEDGSR